jgi:hypothetical protein
MLVLSGSAILALQARSGQATPTSSNPVARFNASTVGVAQLVELLVVVQAVVGSSPIAHPFTAESFLIDR